MAEVSERLDAFTCELIGEAINILETEGELPVLLMTDSDDSLFAFENDDADGCYRAACQQVHDMGKACNMYALAYDGVVQKNDKDSGSPAIIFEFAERETGQAWSGYLFYRVASDGVVEVTDPLPGGEEEPLFA